MVDSMEQLGEIQIPDIEEKKHWNRKWKIAAGIFVGCIVLFAMAAIVFAKYYFTEERALLKAFRNLAGEIQEWQELWEEASGNKPEGDLNRIKLTTIYNLSGDDLPFTLGVDTILLRDADAREMKAGTEFSIMNNKLVEWNIYGEDETLYMSLPDFFEQNLVFDTKQIDVQYNASLFAEKFGAWEDYALSIDLFPVKKPMAWMQYLENWQEGISMEKLETLIDINVLEKDNKQYRCSQYRLTISKDWINDRIPEDAPVLEIAQDIVVVIAVDEKNDRIVRILLEEPFSLSIETEERKIEMKTTGSVSFLGEDRSIDDIVVSMESELPLAVLGLDEQFLAVFGKDGSKDKIRMQMNTELLFDENDTSVTANLHKLTVSVDLFGTYKLTGETVLEPLREAIEPPAGENIRLFEMTEEQYRDLRRQVMQKIGHWMKAYSIFG